MRNSIKVLILISIINLFFTFQTKAQLLSSTFFKKIPEGKSAYVALFADGNIKGIATSGTNKNATGTGALGINVQKGNLSWRAVINVASSIDSLQSGAGTVILNPATGEALESGFIDLRIRNIFKIKDYSIGLHFYGSTSKSKWYSGNNASVSALPSGLGATIYTDIINGEINDNEISFGFELGLSYRWTAGDIAHRENEYLREAILGATSKRFGGLEAGMQIKFGSIIAGIHGYWLTTKLKGGTSISGVTSGQITAGFSISGPIFQGFMDL